MRGYVEFPAFFGADSRSHYVGCSIVAAHNGYDFAGIRIINTAAITLGIVAINAKAPEGSRYGFQRRRVGRVESPISAGFCALAERNRTTRLLSACYAVRFALAG